MLKELIENWPAAVGALIFWGIVIGFYFLYHYSELTDERIIRHNPKYTWKDYWQDYENSNFDID